MIIRDFECSNKLELEVLQLLQIFAHLLLIQVLLQKSIEQNY
jgi:hypothetical protein